MKVFFAHAAPVELASGWTDGLWDEKRERIKRMRHDSDRSLVLTAHRLLFYAIKLTYGFVPHATDFGLEPHGKPYFKSKPDIHFSISHSGEMAMCALHDSPVGADIEKRRAVGAGVPERIMTAEELRLYSRSPDKQRMFFQVWTLKEAYVKYCGAGLSMSMASVTAYPSGNGIATDTGCEFRLIQPTVGYQAAVCAKTDMLSEVLTVDIGQLSLFQ
jgi:4'-phosphopantetheinyl transferase